MNDFLFAAVHEYQMVSPRIARVTASFTQDHLSQDDAYAALQKTLGNAMIPIKASFRWLDEKAGSAIGYVFAPPVTEFIGGDTVPDKYRQIAGNIYMDKADESMWNMREGVGGKYLARQGQEDLTAMLETARVSPRGSQPRMSQVLTASVQERELVSFVSESRRSASVDYGVVLSTGENGSMVVLSHMTTQPVTVKADMVIASFAIDSRKVPPIPKDKVMAMKKSRPKPASISEKVQAADVYSPNLTPQEYWTLQYSYNPEYLAKVLQQVAEMAAL